MKSKTFSIARLVAGGFAALLAVVLVAAQADAKVGGGGSRGSRTFSAPPATKTAPNATQPMQRTTTQPAATQPTAGAPAAANSGGFFNRPGGMFGGGLMGGLAAGFLGAGLFGLLAGHGFMGGLAGFASFLGLVLQVGLVALLAMLAWRWFQRRSEPATAGGPSLRDMTANRSGLGGLNLGGLGGGLGGGSPSPASSGPSDDIGISPNDYDAFERLLGNIQTAYSNEDIAALRSSATPEMVSYFSEDLAENASRGVVNRVSDVKLLQGDLAEAWREGNVEYASVAMRFSLVDQMVERATNNVVEGDERPHEVTEVWTFLRARGGHWVLSAIQGA
ncbi:MAG TPA: TIM44-like domain-containing protein [Xanthobacteraceae bacterium]|nr:TIM44-like domain-containing protein [Xanthobacteraceae bacterium]